MRFLKKVLLVGVTFFLLAVLGLILALKYPVRDPALHASHFAARASMKNLPTLQLQVFETGYSTAPEAYVRRGGELLEKERLTHSVVLIRHPKGNIVLDSGLGMHFSEQVARASWDHRLLDPLTFFPTMPLAKQAAFPILDPKRDFFLISHAHFDHLGGALDFPDIPVRMLAAEKEFSEIPEDPFRHGVFPEQISALKHRLVPIQLKNEPYENFSQSLDLFGDGSIVLVSLAGHTPGSLGVFANLPDGQRILFVGDALWTVDERGQPEARSPVAEWTSDFDKTQARLTRLKLAELIAHSNEVTLVPIHDSRALEKVQKLVSKKL
ncbi:MAG: MBL fold metallo-hydrolase [Deltaproteobacteria bacterium]|nr:MBL fold metallo-hydrolase [Deltaproteobacteria bacterium]